ncbi:hypothetical protein FZEAL_48 [Fusarium zealandicum]|uniref:TPR domain protein n=1 Tax=Fusarium zealandicum TaxID=1053134 RepID=A0A8H4UW62_9HYPO|nr:hypothetical protein FZEAL_48 [Fusarium zealandicum]
MGTLTQAPDLRLDDFILPPLKLNPEIATNHPEARKWVEVGLIWSYSFNHAESARSFEKAIEVDPECAIAYWGLAYALGPNYNKPWALFDQDDVQRTTSLAWKTLQHGRTLAASPTEQALIGAIRHRFPEKAGGKLDFAFQNKAYADAMGAVYQEFGQDMDVAALYADALMNITPWALWDQSTGKPAPGSRVLEAEEVLNKALTQEGGFEHVGILHLYIHLIEMSTEPERALLAADNLRRLAGDAGHLAHMPSHLDVLIGDYRRSIAANAEAIRVSEKLIKLRGVDGFYSMYRMHEYHSLIYAAMFSGQYKTAIETTSQMEASLPDEQLRVESPPMADWLEAFCAVRPHVLVRFGKWREILDLALPEDQKLYCVTTATIHYAKGIAWAILGNVDKACQERELFLKAKSLVPPTRMDYPNKCVEILAVGEAMLDGELQYRLGNIELAFSHLRKSIELDDGLTYSEPWPWMQPARHAYAALLMEQGRFGEAMETYRTDLGFTNETVRGRHHPNNVWALHGYHECAVKLGLEREAEIVRQQLTTALIYADVPIESSCYCRKKDS